MVLSRANYVTNAKLNQVLFSDFSNNLDMNPNSGDLALLTNNSAIAQSLENIILTICGERPYNNVTGSSVPFRVFELASIVETELIVSAVTLAVTQNEPRVNLQNVIVNVEEDENSYSIQLNYTIVNNTVPQTLTVILKRTR